MIEKTMEVDRMEDVISVFGSFDQNLRMIETEYNVRVTDRDEQIHITGEAENVLYAEKAIAGLLSLAAKGEEIGEQNVRYIFRLVREGREQKIQELAGDVVCITAKGKPIKAKTLGQRAYLDAIEQNTITLGVGPAGTGKTYLAVAEAVAAFRAERVNRIILTRPAVEAGEKLGFLPGDIVPFRTTLKVPHMGWNELEFRGSHWLQKGLPAHPYVYFVHSYHKSPADSPDVIATADYGQAVPAICGRDNVLGFQFHPEKSGPVGARLLQNVIEHVQEEG